MNKELAQLISKRNEYKNKNDLESLEKIRQEIKDFKKQPKGKKETVKIEKKTKFSKSDNAYKKKGKKENKKEEKYKSRSKKKKKKKNIKKIQFVHTEPKPKKEKNKDKVFPKQEMLLTKKQEELLHQFYVNNISKCTIDDFVVVFKYYADKYYIDASNLEYYVNYFISNFNDEKNQILIEKFIKNVKKASKDYNDINKNKIKELCLKLNITKVDDFNSERNTYKNSTIFEVISYFINRSDINTINEIIDKYPNITKCNYNNKDIIINVLELMLEKYNIILTNSKDDSNVIQITEDIFVKLYSMDSSKKENIELIINEYIQELKGTKTTTIARNMVLCRINKVKQKLGLNINQPYNDEVYNYLDDYYKKELKNIRRRKVFEDSVVLDELNNVSYSVIKVDDYVTLKINVVDLSIYFLEGSFLEQLLMNNSIDLDIINNYAKYKTGINRPSITFEFIFYKSILKNSTIYNSIVNTTNDKNVKNNYTHDLETINILPNTCDFNELIKLSLKSNFTLPYIVTYCDSNNNYKTMTDLNYLFNKLNKDEFNIILNIINKSNLKYGLSDKITNQFDYDVNVLTPDINFINILQQRIIKSYYDNNYVYNKECIETYVNQKNKVMTKQI